MAGQHSGPDRRSDHLWVLVIIAACALLEVWASWLAIGAVSGFPKLGRMTTGWILPVATEAYEGYAAWAWLAGACGRRSRRFAMASAIAMFCLSLGGQESAHLLAGARGTAPWPVVALVTALPLISVGLVAVLVHLRQADREAAAAEAAARAEAAGEAALLRAEADDRNRLRAELRAAEDRAAGAEAEAAGARREAETERRKAEALTRKLEAATGGRKTGTAKRKPSARKPEAGRPEPAAVSPDDLPGNWDALDTEARVLFLVNERGYPASAAGRAAGVSDARGRQIARMVRDLSATAPQDVISDGDSA